MELYQNDPLYLAIMANDEKKIQQLKKNGFTLSEHIKCALTQAVNGSKMNEYSWTCMAHVVTVQKMKKDKFLSVMRNLYEETGEPLHYTYSLFWALRHDICEKDVFCCMIECFNNKDINKKQTMHEIIDADKAELLSIAEKHGWLKMPRKRDEMIAYASDKNKTECLAWLLDFKNRTANLAEEQEKAEKRLMRELNASPDSVSELKKLWSWQKQEDGTFVITSCKRSLAEQTEITVPSRIGRCAVTAIGAYAFSPYTGRISDETAVFRRKITKITLPDSIKTIARSAFQYCESLEEINIPDGIDAINEGLFDCCSKLKKIQLPASVHRLEAAFAACCELESINIPEGVEIIHNNSFSTCKKLKEVIFPASVHEIDAYAFSGCKALESIIFSKGIKKICQRAFSDCKSLKTLVIPEGAEEIGQCAFEGCENLETVYLPESLKKIKNLSVKDKSPRTPFDGCPNIKAIVHKGSYAEKYCRRNNILYEITE